jgi:RimK family alpha-L-glutamate ligase
MNINPDILFLRTGNYLPKRTEEIKRELEKLGENGVFALYDQLSFYTEGGKDKELQIFINDIDLKQFKVIFFRTIGQDWQLARLICLYLEKLINEKKIKVIDPLIVSGQKYLAAKLCQTLALKKADLPVPKTFYGNLDSLKKKISSYLSFPMVIKRSAGHQGEDVYLVSDKDELSKLIVKLQKEPRHKKFIAQEFIPNQGDIRLYVLGSEVMVAVKRVRQNEDEFRNNLSQGGKAFIVKPTKEINNIAIKAAETLGLGFAGVDIAVRETDQKPFILEVNRSPGYTSTKKSKELGVNISRRIAQYLVQLKKETN